ncbi:hypothetical protein CCAX7_003580 [Capsulimonas corticalis]|uniref:Uncharacterized protein n=1 Tax=Capsulimonas corticalis TaxID=2219043 RepID=A0A402CSA1_9BACT|nr:hypothetical protein [Capsulimonas corticalis]BDI28307.1 hypothetical protein CCAX7_003580 [Capsulimonas corticalis]
MAANTEDAIEEFMGDNPRASEWRALRLSLTDRLKSLLRQHEQETDLGTLANLERQIHTLREQINALGTEEIVSQFVEDSVRVTIARPDLGGEEFED